MRNNGSSGRPGGEDLHSRHCGAAAAPAAPRPRRWSAAPPPRAAARRRQAAPPGRPAPTPSAGALSLVAAETTPRKSFYFGFRYPRLSYTIGSSQPQNDLRIDVVDGAGAIVKTFYRNDVAPDVPTSIRWDGTTQRRPPARNGRYSFRIGPQVPKPRRPARRRASTALSLSFAFYGYAFPILGAHEFGLGAGRFGPPARATPTRART